MKLKPLTVSEETAEKVPRRAPGALLAWVVAVFTFGAAAVVVWCIAFSNAGRPSSNAEVMDIVTVSYLWFGLLGTAITAVACFAWRREAHAIAWAWAIALFAPSAISIGSMIAFSGALSG